MGLSEGPEGSHRYLALPSEQKKAARRKGGHRKGPQWSPSPQWTAQQAHEGEKGRTCSLDYFWQPLVRSAEPRLVCAFVLGGLFWSALGWFHEGTASFPLSC